MSFIPYPWIIVAFLMRPSQSRLGRHPGAGCEFFLLSQVRFSRRRRCRTQKCGQLDLCGSLRPASHPFLIIVANRFAAPAAGDMPLRAFPSKAALSSAHFRPASLDLGLAFRWPISRARRQMYGDRIKCLGLRTDRTSFINATDSICRRARMESQSVVKLGQWARVDDKSNRSRSACGNATCGSFQHFRIAPTRVCRIMI